MLRAMKGKHLPLTIYRAIEPDDCAALVGLHRDCFNAWEVHTSIFCSPQIENYLRQLTAFPVAQREQFLLGAWQEDALVGYASCRALETSWHLNYLAVARDLRGTGIGWALWLACRSEGQKRGFTRHTLDVWADNQNARDWYARAGWETIGQSWVYQRVLARDLKASSGDFRVVNWENAVAWQAAFGFSKFEIACGEKRWTIDRLGEESFRASATLPDEMYSFLHRLDPKRSLLLVSPQPLDGDESGKISLRLELTK